MHSRSKVLPCLLSMFDVLHPRWSADGVWVLFQGSMEALHGSKHGEWSSTPEMSQVSGFSGGRRCVQDVGIVGLWVQCCQD